VSRTGRFLFWPGQIVATPGAIEAFSTSGESPFDFLMRHLTGDWGDLDAHDLNANEAAVEQGLRVISCYRLSSNERIWVITEADRSVTTFLLPEEY
jgi:hypothetical protein